MQRMFLNWSNIFSSNSRAEIQDKQHHTNKLDSNAIESEIQEQKSRKTNKGVSSVFLMFCPLYHHLSKWSQNTDKTLYCCLIVFTLDWGILLLKGTPSFYTLGVNYPRQVCWLSLSPENVVWGDRWLCLTSKVKTMWVKMIMKEVFRLFEQEILAMTKNGVSFRRWSPSIVRKWVCNARGGGNRFFHLFHSSLRSSWTDNSMFVRMSWFLLLSNLNTQRMLTTEMVISRWGGFSIIGRHQRHQ